MTKTDKGIQRRSFLWGGVLAGMAAGVAPRLFRAAPTKETPLDTKKILNYQPGMKYRRLGSTDMHLSALSLGGLVMVEAVHHYAIERGVNLVHISEGYLNGRAIKSLGNVLKTKRDKVYLALKDNISSMDEVLKTLNTDYVDFFMFNRHDKSSAVDASIMETFEKYKKQGKVRFAGLTSHGNVKEATNAGIQSGMYSIVMPVLHQPSLESMDAELRLAHEKGVGVMAMKTMKGMDGLDMQVAYVKKALSNPGVTTVLKGFGSFEMFDAYLKGAQETLTSLEDKLLYRHAQVNREQNCMMCDQCKAACPRGVEVSSILRCKDYYYEQMNDRETALATYQAIPEVLRGNPACQDCQKCEQACPNGIKIVNRLEAARQLFA